MMRIRWLIDDRAIPNYGVAARGQEVMMAADLAAGYVKQGEAEHVDTESEKPTVTTSRRKSREGGE